MDGGFSVLFNLIMIPIVGALIGWITNVLAIIAIFRPYEPVRILGWEWQGVIPKRKEELARVIGEVVEEELINIEDVIRQLEQCKIKEHVLSSIMVAVDKRVKEKLRTFLPLGLREVASEFVVDLIIREVKHYLDDTTDSIVCVVRSRIKISELVEARLKTFDVRELEILIQRVANRELKYIEILGGVLGFAVGLIQDAFVYFLR
jgi:uncharacterized membrane protein YheB (UPF0754 family)